MSEIIYPGEPPKEPPKPVFHKPEPGEKPKPPEGLWMTHDPAIYQDDVSGNYYIYGTGAVCQRSRDLVHWEKVGRVVEKPPKEAADWTGGKKAGNIWAPDIVKVGEEYRLYCSNSTWGVRQSCIFLAVSDNAEGPFIPRGIVLKTSDKLPVNAIDANIITDVKTNEMYMVYGSFWGGVHILKLDRESGLAAEEGIGTCLARRPMWLSAAIEGPYMIYNPDTEYYYLFVSYGSLKTDYQVRVGRSRSVLGPFVDFHGRELTDDNDPDNRVGQMQICGYCWNDGTPYMAPGHNSVLHDKDGSWYLVYHVREKNFRGRGEPSTMQIRRLYWMDNGWPVVSAEPFSGEIDQEIPGSALEGFYERINLIKTVPQGIQTAVPLKLENENNYYECCSIVGKWDYQDGMVSFQYGPHKEKAFVSAVWDHERNCPTIAMCGMSEDGVPFWAKRIHD